MKARCPRPCGSGHCSNSLTEMIDMTRRRFGVRLALVTIIAAASAAPALAQPAEPAPQAARPISAGDVLSGELNALKIRGGKKGKRVATYQLTSEPRRLPPPNGPCGVDSRTAYFHIVS